jgi:hypothetical protein
MKRVRRLCISVRDVAAKGQIAERVRDAVEHRSHEAQTSFVEMSKYGLNFTAVPFEAKHETENAM